MCECYRKVTGNEVTLGCDANRKKLMHGVA